MGRLLMMLSRHRGHAQGVGEPVVTGIAALVTGKEGDDDDQPGAGEDPHGDEYGPSDVQRCTDSAARAEVLATFERKGDVCDPTQAHEVSRLNNAH